MRLKTAWVGQEPKTSAGEAFGLATDHGSGSIKGRAVGLQPKDGDAPGTQLPHLGLELRSPFPKFGRTDFASGGCRPSDQVRDAYTKPRQCVLLGRQEHGPGEPAGMEQLPEPVPPPGEMQAEVT